MPEVAFFPLDVATLTKGQVLSVEELEKLFGMKYPDPQWWSKLLWLRTKIAQQRERRELPVITMRTSKGTLIICDDPDASTYNHSMGKRGIRRFSRAAHRNVFVDATKLSDEERQAHGRTIMRQAMMLTAIRSTAHRALPSPDGNGAKRVTPKMVKGPVVK